ncbi:MAG: IPT/TIG domain-containing protein, partial [Bdellovibrionota bacterium]
MKSFVRAMLLLIVLPALSACTQKMAQTSVKISKISFAGKSSTTPMMLWGQGPKGQTVNAFIEAGKSDASVEVPLGAWSFYVIMWSGPNQLEGTTSCGMASKTLTTSEESVSLSITAADCALPQFSASTHLAGNAFLPVKLIKCSATLSSPAAGSNCDSTMGPSPSFRFVLSGKMTSQCHSSFADSVATTALRIPVSTTNTVFAASIQTFSTSDCTGTPSNTFALPSGLGVASDGKVAVTASGGYTEVFVADVGTGTTPTPSPSPSPSPTATPGPPPTVTSISPTSGDPAGGVAVTITGSDFVSPTDVQIGGTSCTSIVLVSSTTITCVTPALSSGTTYAVQVTNLDGQDASSGSIYIANGPPTISGISPAAGPVAGGQSVTITGTGFLAGATIDIGGTS